MITWLNLCITDLLNQCTLGTDVKNDGGWWSKDQTLSFSKCQPAKSKMKQDTYVQISGTYLRRAVAITSVFLINPIRLSMILCSEICCIVGSWERPHLSVRKPKENLKRVCSNRPLIRVLCAQNCIWSDRPRRNWPLIYETSSRPLSRKTWA